MVSELILSNLSIRQVYVNKDISEESMELFSKGLKNTEMVSLGRDTMQKISMHSTAPSVIALVEIPDYGFLEMQGPVLVLDEIQDPGNLGTLIRIADWFHFGGIFCSKGTVSWHNPKVIQSSMGSFIRIPIREGDIREYLSTCKRRIYGASLTGGSIYQENISDLEILVLGNESKGISEDVQSYIQNLIRIPGFGQAESLNVAVAGGIICSEFIRQRQQ